MAAFFDTLTGRSGHEGQTASPCQIWWWSVKSLQRYGDFWFFQDSGCLPSWLWLCDAHVWTTQEGYLVFYHCAKFDWNRCRNFDNMQVLIFYDLDLKTLVFTPQNWGFWGQNRGRGGAMLTPNELLTFGGCYLCATFGENRSRNATVRVWTDRRTRALTD